MNNSIELKINGITNSYPVGITLFELSKYFQEKMANPIIAAKINNIVAPLYNQVKNNCEINFIDVNDINGQSMYLAGLKFILLVAIKELFGPSSDIEYLNSLDKGIYAEVKIGEKLTPEIIQKINNKIKEIVDMDFLFEKITVNKKEAINFLLKNGEIEKAKNIQNLSNSTVVFFKLKNYFNYFYTDLPYSTKTINKYAIDIDDDYHLILRFPTARSNNQIPDFSHCYKTLQCFSRYRNWLSEVKAPYVANLNDLVSDNKIKEFIQINEIYCDSQFQELAQNIKNKKEIKVVLMAGPSSSGKTTSAHKLSLYLKYNGISSIIVSADDYFKEKEFYEKDENGEPDFESPNSIDIKLLDTQITDMLAGKEVSVPKFNFFTGRKEYKGKVVKLKEKDIIILEGIHCLNGYFASSVPEDAKYRVYISPFMPIRIDKHNYISTVDLRLLRRIVRDAVFRGYSVDATIASWQKVRKGEEKYIFPYQEDVDYTINTSLAFELGLLKVYAEPLLYSVPVNSLYYEEARRLLGYLRIYLPITSEYLSTSSILREFTGGSVFNPH